MKKIILAFGIFCSIGTVCNPTSVKAQTAEIESADEIESGDLMPIKNGSSVSGYAFVAKLDSDKENKKMRLKIFDENLKEAGSADFEIPKNAIIKQAFFEGGALMLAVEEPISLREKKEFVKIFQLESKVSTTVAYEPDEDEQSSGMFGRAMAMSATAVPFKGRFKTVEGLGLIGTYVSTNKNGGLTAQLVGTDGRRKWKHKITGKEGKRMDVHLLTTTPKTVLFFATERDGIMDRDSKNLLIGLDAQTGRQVFRQSMEVGKEAWEPVFFKSMPGDDENTLTVCNMVSDVDDKFYKADNTGFNYGKLNLTTGVFTDVKTIDYSEQLSKVLGMKNESKSEEGYLFIEDLILMPDNNMVVVGEFFRNTVSAGGVAMTLLSRGGSGSVEQGTVGDLFALRLSADGAVQSLDKIDKDVRRCQAYTGISTGLLCRYMAAVGAFSYKYTDELADSRKTVIVESNMKSGERGINAITFTPGKGYKVKNLVSNSGSGNYAVLQGKPGYVLVLKSDKKGKKATMSFQQVD